MRNGPYWPLSGGGGIVLPGRVDVRRTVLCVLEVAKEGSWQTG